MLNTIPEGVIVYDNNNRIVSMNTTAADFIGQPAEHPDEMSMDEYASILKEKYGRDIISSLLSEPGRHRLKIEAGRKFYEILCFPIESNGEHDEQYMMTIKDVTTDEVNNNKLLQSSKMIAVGQLAAGMAHQLRNPMGVIRTQTYMLKKDRGLTDSMKKSLDYIDDNVQRASTIIDNVMNFWRITDDTLSTISLHEMIEMIVELNQSQITKKNAKVIIHCDDNLSIRSNTESLKHILLNVFQNAIEAVDYRTGKITLEAKREGNTAVITCRDNGPGIPKENIESLFNPFFTTKPPGKGTGLGLFITYNEVKRLNGDISVRSNPGEGTEFTIEIPSE
ncbi:MAG: ATP-binding protein [Anaerovoracaceae bacterium]